jgi:hypothetical protein
MAMCGLLLGAMSRSESGNKLTATPAEQNMQIRSFACFFLALRCANVTPAPDGLGMRNKLANRQHTIHGYRQECTTVA